jgi:hypothetical protein
MSNINKTSSVNDLISILGSKSTNKISRSSVEKNQDKRTPETTQTVDDLKTELIKAVSHFDLTSENDAKQARDFLVKKMLHWQFSEFDQSAVELSNLATKVIKELNQSPEAKQKLNSLLHDLQNPG